MTGAKMQTVSKPGRVSCGMNDWQLQQFLDVFERKVDQYLTTPIVDRCSAHLGELARAHSWAHLTAGRAPEGLETPDPDEFHGIGFAEEGGKCLHCSDPVDGNSYSLLILPGAVTLRGTFGHNVMTRVHYVGSETDERSNLTLMNFQDLSYAVRSAIRVAMIFTLVFGTTEIAWRLAHHFASSRVKFSVDELKALTPRPNTVNNVHSLHDSSM